MNKNKSRKTYIGGQAVLEGVMMRGKTAMATAVRDAEGNIQVESVRLKPEEKTSRLAKLPIIRGVVSFISSLVGGSRTLMRSAAVFGEEEEEPSRFEKWLAKKCKIDVMTIILGFSTVIGILFAVGLFVFLPQLLVSLIGSWTGLASTGWQGVAYNLIEGGIRILIFVLYILLMTCMKDIRRTFMYHGAEHKTITCFEKGLDLTVENVRPCSRVHDRCGTTFLFFVMVVSILVFSIANSLLEPLYVAETVAHYKVWNFLIRFAIKIALLPLVAGLSFELLRGLAKSDSKLLLPLKAPGLLLQRLTTQEPDDAMIEVAIRAFRTVYDMDADPTLPVTSFITPRKLSEYLAEVKQRFSESGIDDSDAEWIFSLVLNVPRSRLTEEAQMTLDQVRRTEKYVQERLTGRPLWYIVGDTEFYGYKIKVDERVLIPRPETEILAEMAIRTVRPQDKVLEICTGSGAVAIAVSKEKHIHVDASDISEDALALAAENAALHEADVRFFASDMLRSAESDYNVIIANPPYIKRGEIPVIQKEVREFEPYIALDGGEDGLDFYRIIAREAVLHLKDGHGTVLMETGEDEAVLVAALFTDASKAQIVKDLEGRDRVVVITYA